MEMITPSEISDDEDLARRVLVRARSIAPCLNSLDEESTKDARAILRGVVAEIPPPGSRRVRSRARNGTSVSYTDLGGAFSDDDIAGLRAMCSAAAAPGLPIGSFPRARPIGRVWPEERYE
jgi:hypothetical protein